MKLAVLGLFLAVGAATPIETTRQMLDLTIVTNYPAKAKEFYGDILGLKVVVASGDTTTYQIGEGTIDLLAAPKPLQAYPGFEGGIGISGIALYLTDADRFANRMHDHGKPEPNFLAPRPDIKVARVTDPDGNWVELIFLKTPQNQMAIIFQVADEARSREFYGKTLGMPDAPPHGKSETGLLYAYTAGGSSVLVRGAKKGSTVHTGPIAAFAGLRSIRFTVKDVDAVASALKQSGVSIPVAPHDGPHGSRAMFIADPDGNYLEFVSLPCNPAVRYTFFPGSRLVQQEAVVKTSEPDITYYYDAGTSTIAANAFEHLAIRLSRRRGARHPPVARRQRASRRRLRRTVRSVIQIMDSNTVTWSAPEPNRGPRQGWRGVLPWKVCG